MKLAEATKFHRKSGGAKWRDLRLMRFLRLSQELIPIRPLLQKPNLDRSAWAKLRSPLRGWILYGFELRHPSPWSRYNESGVLRPNTLQAIREDMTKTHQHPLEKILESRIAIIDGAMGTTIRTYGMKEAEIRGQRFKDSKKDLLNNGDLFSLTQPKMIGDIHRRFLEAGADIIETNTFGATSITQSEFFVDDPREHGGRKDPEFYQKVIEDKFLGDLAWEINEQSARQCREWADRVGNQTSRQRFVAGAIGPLTVSLSNSPDADDPGFRVVTFDQVKAAYAQQVRALIAGGSDLLLVETIFDSLNAKAALVAIREVFDQDGKQLPVMISAAVGRGGETVISAQTTEAFWNAVQHVKPLSVGLNCSLGPDLMYPFLEELSDKANVAISCYPNAGLPNPLSETGFDLGPNDMARYLGDFARGGLINIAGGCCGNTPEHIAAIAKALEGQPPRSLDAYTRESAA